MESASPPSLKFRLQRRRGHPCAAARRARPEPSARGSPPSSLSKMRRTRLSISRSRRRRRLPAQAPGRERRRGSGSRSSSRSFAARAETQCRVLHLLAADSISPEAAGASGAPSPLVRCRRDVPQARRVGAHP